MRKRKPGGRGRDFCTEVGDWLLITVRFLMRNTGKKILGGAGVVCWLEFFNAGLSGRCNAAEIKKAIGEPVAETTVLWARPSPQARIDQRVY